MTRGFTLIETVVYIALLSLIMSGALAATYELLSGEGRAQGHDTTGAEGGFVLGKFAWAMNDATSSAAILSPAVGTSGSTFLVRRTDGTLAQICFAASAVRMGTTSCAASSEALTTANASTTALSFYHIPASGAGPEGVAASTTINGVTFSATRYLRQ